jgi:two-component system, NarL family, sensor histidine kinase DesK
MSVPQLRPRLGSVQTTGPPIRSSRVGVAGPAVAIVALLLLLVSGTQGPAAAIVPVVIAALAVGAAAWTLASLGRQRRRYDEKLATWAGERAAQAERLRIARDLHDLVSHGLGLITVRAASAAGLAGPGAEAERAAALSDVERVSRQTTTELRRMLAVLRTTDPAPLRPAESLGDLPAIVGVAREAGLQVTLDPVDLGDLSSGVQLAACAIVREGLSNAARHAGPTRARVSLHREGDTIEVVVHDDGPVPAWIPQPGAGHGLAGLAERVTALGGTLDPSRTGAGFRLAARLPDRG